MRAIVLLFRRSAVAVVGLACLLPGACDSKPPDYLVQTDVLRLVPESSSVGSEGGPVYVLLELTRADQSKQSIVFAESRGATLSALPGQGSCSGASDGSAGGASGGDTGSSLTRAVVLALPPSELLVDTVRPPVRETGFVLDVPAGDTDVLLVATAFDHTGPENGCESRGAAVAVASARITRSKAEAAEGGMGAREGGASHDSGGTGGSSNAGTGGTSSGSGGLGGTAGSSEGGASGSGGASNGGANANGSGEGGT